MNTTVIALTASGWTEHRQASKTEFLCHHPLRFEDDPLHLPLHDSPLYLLVLPCCRAAFSIIVAEVVAEMVPVRRIPKTLPNFSLFPVTLTLPASVHNQKHPHLGCFEHCGTFLPP